MNETIFERWAKDCKIIETGLKSISNRRIYFGKSGVTNDKKRQIQSSGSRNRTK